MSPLCCNTSRRCVHSPLYWISFSFSSHHFFFLLFVKTHPKGAFSFCFLSNVTHPRDASILPFTKSPFLSGHHSLFLSFLLQCILRVCYLSISSLLQCIPWLCYLSPLYRISFFLSMAIMFSLSLLFFATHPKGAHVLSFLPNRSFSP